MAGDTPFVIIPELTAIAVRYSNPASSLIADQVLPRTPALGVKTYRWRTYDVAQGFTVPDTRVGRRGRPNDVEFTGTEQTSEVFDYGLGDSIPQSDIDQAAAARAMQNGIGQDPEMLATEYVTGLVDLDREVRVAALVFNPNTYPTQNTLVMAGGSQFDQPGSTPVTVINQALDSTLIYRPNTMTIGRQAWTKVRTNPQLVSAILGNAGTSGIVTKQQVADLFELQNILIGDGYLNTARKGQAANMQRVWGKHISLTYLDPTAAANEGITFGFTAQYKGKRAYSKQDSDIGLDGGVRLKVGDSVREQVVAPDTGFFLQNVVS